MADVNSNININFNTEAALAQLRLLQAGLSRFHQSLAEGNLAAANAQKGLNAQLLQSIGATGKFSASQVKVAGSTLAFTSALEKNKLSLREYFRYTMAAATANTRVLGRAFAQEREIINRARRDRVKALQAQYIQMNKSNAGFMDAIRIMPKALAMANGKFTELGTRIQYAAQRQQFLNQLLKQGSTQLLNFGKNTQWAGRQLMVGLTMPLALFGASAAKTFRELETEIVKFKRVYGDAFTNDAETDAAVENIRKLATEYTKYGVSVTKTMEMAATAAAAGFQGGALNAQVETATKLSVLGQIEQQQALETTISLQSAFGLSSEELAKKIDFLNAVENQTLLSIEDLTIAIPKAAPVMKQLGGTVEDLAFFMTAMKEGGINASEGANALKSGLASLINPSDKAAKFLGNLGINIKGIVEGNKGDIKATVVGFAQALDTLDPLNRARAIEQMFGKFQFARLSTLFQNVTKDSTQASRALGLAGASVEELAILSEREMKKIEDSVGVKFQAAIEQFKQEIMPLGKIFLEALTPVVKFFGNLFEKFNGLSDSTKKIVAIIVGTLAGIGPVVLMTFGLLANGIANVIKFFAMLRGGIARLNGQTNIMGAGFNYMTQEQIENAASSQQLHQTHTRLIEVFNVEANSVNALASSYNSLSTQMRAMASQNPALFAGGMGGAKAAVRKLPPVRKYKDGILTVPGPKGAGDIQPAMLAPGEAVIPAKTTEKYKGLISAIFRDKVPGFMAGRIPARVSKAATIAPPHPERQSGAVFVGMPVPAAQAAQSREILEKISTGVKSGRFGTMPPSDFGTLLQPFSGRSFPARGVGGVYRKPNGEVVVVKPTIDEKTALAEVRATEIAREVHGLIAPKQSIRTMVDPTDPTGQRKFIVIESPYDPRIAAMDGKFTKRDMIKQLVASTLRGDKDLQKPNLSGRVLADVGTAGVFDRASGFRDFSSAMPSMEQQAVVNLLGVKGGAKKFFAQETSGIAAKMSPAEYDAAIKAEIQKSIPKLERLIKTWDLDPSEKIVYGSMLDRLKAGAKTDWDKLQPIHARAGEGIKKAIKGVDPDATPSEIKKQQSRYEAAQQGKKSKTQIDRLVTQLNQDVENTLKELKKTNPQQYKKAIELLKKSGADLKESGAIDLKKSKIYTDFIAKDLVYKDGAYHTTKAIEKGQSPTTSGKSYDAIRDQLLYRMGAAPKPGTETFSNKPFTASRLREDLTSTTQSGGWRSNIDRKSDLYKALDQAEKEHKARNIANPTNAALNKLRSQMIADGYTVKQVDAMLRTELSHLSKTGEAGLGPEKWKKGFAKFDLRLLNSYVNPGGKAGQPVQSPRLEKILNWDAKNGNVLFNSTQTAELKKALEFIKTGAHPITESQARLVQAAADAQIKADEHLQRYKAENNGRKPKGFPDLGSVRQARAVSTLLSDRLGGGYYQGTPTIYRLGPGSVLATPGEYLADLEKGTAEKLSVGNTKSRPMGARPSTGKPKENLTVQETPTKRVVTQSQVRRGGFTMTGRDAGDPNATALKNPTVKQGELAVKLRERGFTQSEIDRTLRRFAETELRNKERQVKESEKAARTETARQKEQAKIQQRQTDLARARYAEEQRRAQLNYQQAVNYDDAVKEDQARTLKNQKQTQKAATKQQRNLRAEKVGRFSGGASMALGTAGMGLMMAGNQTGGMAMMGASAVAGLAPMLTNPIAAVAAGLLAVAGAVYAFNAAMKKAREEGIALANAMSMTNDKLISLSKITQTVSASEEADKKRQDRLAGATEKQRKVGQTILDSEFGKSLLADIDKQAKAGMSSKEVGQNIGVQLSSAMLSGVITSEQARSMAMALGNELKDYPLSANIVGEIIRITGPNGEDIKKDPIKVALDIDKKTFQTSKKMVNFAGDQDFGKSFFGKGGTFENANNALTGKKGFVQKTLAGINPFIYQDFFDPKKSGLDKTLSIVSFGLTSSFFQIRDANAQTNRIRTAGAQLMIQELANNQQMIDSLNKQYDIKLKTAKNEKEIATIEGERKDALEALNKQNQDQLNTILASKDKIGDTAFNAAIKGAVDQLYKKGPLAELKNVALDQLEALENSSFKTQMQLDFASGLIDPMTLIELLNNPDYQSSWNLLVTTTLGGNTAEAAVISQLLSKAGLDIESKKIVIDLLNNKGDNFTTEDITAAIDTLSKIQETYGIVLDVNVNTEEKIKRITDAVKFLNGRKFVTKAELQSDKKYDYIVANWETLVGEGDTISRTLLLNVLTLVSDQNVLDAYLQAAGTEEERQIIKKSRNQNPLFPDLFPDPRIKEIEQKSGIWAADPKNAAKLRALGLGGNEVGGDVTKTDPLDFLKPLAMSLKQVADNAFNALKPVESLLAAFTNKKTQQDAFNLFDGIQNRLLRFGAGEGLRDAIASMSAEDFAKIAALPKNKALFTFAKGKPRSKDTITGLTQLGKATNQGMMKRDVADFNLANEVSIENIKNQTKAYNILISSGLSAGQALEVVANKGQAAAIASGAIKKSDPNWKDYISNIKTSSTELERQAVLNKAIRENEDFKMYKEMPKLASQMKGLGYTTDQINAALSDPELAKFLIEDLADGKVDAKAIADYLNSIEERKIIEIQTKYNAGQYSESALPGLEVVDQRFAVREKILRTGADPATTAMVDQMNANDIAIKNAEISAAKFREEITKINREIEKDQRVIEEKYSRPIEKLSEEVNDLSRELEMSPLFGDRVIQTIQDENSVLSNDLSLISNAAEEVNKRYDDQAEALQKVSDINQNILDQQKQQVDLADAITSGDISAAAKAVQEIRAGNAARFADAQSQALEQARQNALGSLTGSRGLTEEQINKKQFENSQRIYAMENDPRRLDIIKKIQSKQDEIYNNEEDREKALLAIRDKEDEIFKIQQLQLSPLEMKIEDLTSANNLIQLQIDKLVSELRELGYTQIEWDKIKSKIDANAIAGQNFDTVLGQLLASTTAIDGMWTSILGKLGKYSTTPKEVLDEKKKVEDKAAQDNMIAEIKKSMVGVRLGDEGDYLDSKGKLIVTKKAKGGIVPNSFAAGAYAQGTDTVPAMLTPGEYVLRKSAVEKYGVKNLDAMNVGYYKDGGSVLGGIFGGVSNLWKKVQSNPNATSLHNVGTTLLKEVGTMLQMAGSTVAPALIPKVSKDQGKSLAEFSQVPGVYRALTGKSSEGPLGQDSLTAQRLLDWSSVAGLFIPGAKVGAAKAGVANPITSSAKTVTSSAAKSPGLVKKIVTLPKTRKAEALQKEADFQKEMAAAAEFKRNNPPPPPRPSGPGAPTQKPAASLWDDTIESLLPDNPFTSFVDTPAPLPQSPIKTIVSNIASTIAKPVTVPAKFISKISNIVASSWKYGTNESTRWGGNFDYYGRQMLMREISSRTVGRIAEKLNPKLTIKDKVKKLDPREPAINAYSKLQKYMSPLEGGRGIYDLQYRNIPKNVLQNFVKTPIAKAKVTFSELRQLASAGLSSANPLIRGMAKGRAATNNEVQAIVDAIPGGFGGLVQLLRGIHRASTPYDGPPKSIYERLADAKSGAGPIPANSYGPGNYFATSDLMSETFFKSFGQYGYKTAMTPSAILKVLRSKGFATREQVQQVAEKYNMPGANLEAIGYNADHPLVAALIDEGYLGYRHNDAFTNWMIGLMPGMGFKLVGRPKVPTIGATTLPDGSIDIGPITEVPKRVIRKAKGGIVPNYFAAGGFAKGTDTVPAMLTPGEFVMSKYAVDTYGVENMKAINSGSSIGDSVYNYNLNVNVKSDANPDDIARAVMVQIKSVDAQRIRGARL